MKKRHSVQNSGFFCHSEFTWNQKLAFGTFLNAQIVILMNFCIYWEQKLPKNQKLESPKMAKMPFFELLKYPKLISRKIWVTENAQISTLCSIDLNLIFLREINFALSFADVSCNTCPWLLNTLQHLDFNFSCQSRPEIQHILAQNIDPSRVLFANPTKVASHMKAAVSNGVDLMVFGSLHELKVIFVHFWQFWAILVI